jgi:hypothetical protein
LGLNETFAMRQLTLANRSFGVNRVISSDAPPRPLFTQLPTYRCFAANRRFGPAPEVFIITAIQSPHPRVVRLLQSNVVEREFIECEET